MDRDWVSAMSCSKLREWTVHWGKCPAACTWQSGVYTCMVPSSKYPPFLYSKWSRGSSSDHMTYYMSGKNCCPFRWSHLKRKRLLARVAQVFVASLLEARNTAPAMLKKCMYTESMSVCVYIYLYIHTWVPTYIFHTYTYNIMQWAPWYQWPQPAWHKSHKIRIKLALEQSVFHSDIWIRDVATMESHALALWNRCCLLGRKPAMFGLTELTGLTIHEKKHWKKPWPSAIIASFFWK